jgi:flagellar hook-associated protein 2
LPGRKHSNSANQTNGGLKGVSVASSVSSLLTGLGTNTGLGTGASTGNSTGLGQGIDVNSFVQLALAPETANITSLQAQQATVNNESSALSAITSNLTALQSAASALSDPLGVLSSEITTSSNPNAVTATASSSSLPGAHTIAITSLATTSSLYSDTVATSNTPLATGDTISISAGGTPVASVTVGSTNNTLAQIAAAINNQATSYASDSVASGTTTLGIGDTISISGGGSSIATVAVNSTNNTLTGIATAINNETSLVHASVITDTNGAHLSIVNALGGPGNLAITGNLHLPNTTAINFTQVVEARASVINDANGARLAVVSGASGAPGNLTITGSLHRIDNSAVNFTQAVPGLNAVLSVDGVPISSTTNTVSNVINGVTLNLEGPTTNGPATLIVAPDTSSITAAVNQLVSSYNTAITAINAQFQVSSSGTGGGSLEADNSLRDAQQTLLNAITYSTAGNGGAVNLTNLGISVNNDGTLSVDSGALATALFSNFSGVQNFLQSPSSGFAANLNTVLSGMTDSTTGTLGLDAQGLTQSSLDLTNQISDLQASIAVQTQNLTAVYAQVNTTLQELPLLQQQLSQQLASIP